MPLNKYIRPFIGQYNNCELVVHSFLKELDIHVPLTLLKKQLDAHPDYPSMLAISDVLSNYSVKSTSIKTEIEGLDEVDEPLIAQIQIRGDDYFTVILKMHSGIVDFLDPIHLRYRKMKIEEFNIFFSRIILFADGSGYKKELFNSEFKTEFRQAVNKIFLLSIFPFLFIGISGISLVKGGVSSICPVLFAFLSFIGFFITVFLNWYEFDQQNPALQQICSFGEKTNCGAIINSKSSKILGISWAKIGFVYFFGELFSLLASGILSHPILGMLSIINILTLPYIVFSVYYQGVIVKKWCPLCLAIQMILALQFCVSLLGGFAILSQLRQISLNDIFSLIIPFILSYYIVELFFPIFLQSKKYKSAFTDFRKLKLNPRVFDSLLKSREEIQTSSDGLGVTIGCSSAKYKIVMASNPYCDPCSRAHKVLEDLIEKNSDIQLRILFPSGGGHNGDRIQAIRHFLYIREKHDDSSLKTAIDAWYSATEKDYNAFAEKFPVENENLKNYDHDIEDMSNWCAKMNINVTPTFFINGFKLPDIYNITDLTYLLSI